MKIDETDKIVLKRKGILFAEYPPVGSPINHPFAVSFQAELMNLSHVMDRTSIDYLGACSNEELVRLHNEYLPEIAKLIGAEQNYRPLYRGYPQEVIEKSMYGLFMDAVNHYYSSGTWEPSPRIHKSYKFEDFVGFKKLSLHPIDCKDVVLKGLAMDIIRSNAVIPNSDRDDFENIYDVLTPGSRACILVCDMSFKENLAILISKTLQ